MSKIKIVLDAISTDGNLEEIVKGAFKNISSNSFSKGRIFGSILSFSFLWLNICKVPKLVKTLFPLYGSRGFPVSAISPDSHS